MKYFLKLIFQESYTEVTREQYIQAERNAGFFPKSGDGIATAGFSNGSVNGKVKYEEGD